MLKIGEFSKLSMLTVKTLRFYEKEALLIPASIDNQSGYRQYETSQLITAATIKSYRQLGLSIEEIRAIFAGIQAKSILEAKAEELKAQQEDISARLSVIYHLLEENNMKYQVVVKEIPSCIVYYEEATLANYSDIMSFIPASGAECLRLNPTLKCAEPEYEFLEYLDCEYRETNIRVRHNQAVTAFGTENARIKFRTIPASKVLSIFHKGAYEKLGEAYAYIYKYAEDNGYKIAGYSRESYIDGIWNKENVEDWLTEIQLPIA